MAELGDRVADAIVICRDVIGQDTMRCQSGSAPSYPATASEPLEPASLGVLADRPRAPRVNHAPAERLDAFQRLGDIAYREVGQGEGIVGSTSAGMDADRRCFRVRLAALSLSRMAYL
jgi:hypothetical protein